MVSLIFYRKALRLRWLVERRENHAELACLTKTYSVVSINFFKEI